MLRHLRESMVCQMLPFACSQQYTKYSVCWLAQMTLCITMLCYFLVSFGPKIISKVQQISCWYIYLLLLANVALPLVCHLQELWSVEEANPTEVLGVLEHEEEVQVTNNDSQQLSKSPEISKPPSRSYTETDYDVDWHKKTNTFQSITHFHAYL